MMKGWRGGVLVLILLGAAAGAGMFAEEFGHLKPRELLTEVRTPGGQSRAALFRGKIPGEYESPLHFYFYLCQAGSCRWVSTPESLFAELGNLQFVDERTLLFTGSTETWMASYLIDLGSGKVTALGGGQAEYLKKGKNAGLFLLHGMKGYVTDDEGEALGAYWANMLVDRDGNFIEMLSDKRTGNCYPLRFLLPREERYPRLRQSFDTKVCVTQ